MPTKSSHPRILGKTGGGQSSFGGLGTIAFFLAIASRKARRGHGRVVFEGTPSELAADATVRHAWLEV
jgi:branched-chain amino acid transport system ATP-binding protein